MKSKITAAVLAFFLGWLGAHKFYLNQPGMGVLYILFMWTGIPWLIAIVEGILYLTMDDFAFQAKYGDRNLQEPPPQQIAQNVTFTLPESHASPSASISEELTKLHDLHTAGLLTDDEFQSQKQRLLR
ncbi:NINE protein [Persicimonas caeni]|uniref:NINE protein n=1 Tax=Persicimonas caeni TaxID=2292766 RepID=A0A4Y6PS38_PERCE|nr:NINE protein [Persicimonas caeni]QDG51131.1 NINE protein [Persicimonas caeni]QED32352.1 NINE protein [Persicimonas caeni]